MRLYVLYHSFWEFLVHLIPQCQYKKPSPFKNKLEFNKGYIDINRYPSDGAIVDFPYVFHCKGSLDQNQGYANKKSGPQGMNISYKLM